MDFFDSIRATPKQVREAHTIVTMEIGSMKQSKIDSNLCYVCQKYVCKSECDICHHAVCPNCIFQCQRCPRKVCRFCLHGQDEEISTCYKCLP